MRIVIDGRFWAQSGIGRYIRNLVSELQKIDGSDRPGGKNEYYILFLENDFKTIKFTNQNFHKILANFKWYGFGEQVKLLKVLNDLKPDLVHFPHFNVPILYKGKYIVTIHDLIHQHYQTRETSTLNPLLHTLKKIGYKKVFSSAVKKAAKIITPSKFVKDQLKLEWKIDSKKIIVTYEGVDEEVLKSIKESRDEDFHMVRKKFGITQPYLFYVGNAQPHKNIMKLVEAYKILKENNDNLSLVLSGPHHYFWEKIKRDVEKLDVRDVIFTGLVSDEELVALYKNAQCFVMPSLEEGFGIPILEAMAVGCPVASSNTASLPEVGVDGATYFNPEDENDMAEKINMVLADQKLRKNLITKGEQRYKQFSWQKMAQETLKIYMSLE